MIRQLVSASDYISASISTSSPALASGLGIGLEPRAPPRPRPRDAFGNSFRWRNQPRYLSFAKGVMDSNDLPLSVSREILQESRIVRIMRKRLVRKIFDMIQEISDSEDKEDYKKFWENFGKLIKLGCFEDSGNHKRLAPLLRFYSSKNEGDMISLDQYVECMGENQKAIYYLATDSLKSAKTAPFLEKLVQKDI